MRPFNNLTVPFGSCIGQNQKSCTKISQTRTINQHDKQATDHHRTPMMSSTVTGQTLECKTLKEGKFKLENQGSGLTLITRTGDIQREENDQYKIITEDKIEWINECTYRLIPYKVIKNESGIDMSIDLKLEIEIIKINKDSYIQRTTSRVTSKSLEAEVKIIN
jgi:hypothetical protein